jgi:hypothetical protein
MADDSNIEVQFGAKTDDLEAGIDRAKNTVQSFAADIKSLSGELGKMGDSATAAGGKLSATLSARQAARAAMEDAHGQIQAANLAYQNEMEKLNSAFALHQITEQEKTAETIAAINQREDAELAALNAAEAAELAASNKTEAAQQRTAQAVERIENQKNAIIGRSINERLKAEEQAALKSAQEWKAAADQVASAFNSQLQKLLAGTEKWSQAMKNIAADLVLKMIEGQVKATAEFIAEKAREVAVALTAEQSKSAAAEAGAALRSAAEVATGQTSILAVIGNALKSIFASASQTGAEVSAAVAPEAGPAAPAIGAGAMATVAAFASTGKFDVGTDYVVRGGLAVIHQGETIVPAARGSGPYTGAGMGSTVHAPVSVNVSALDSRSIERFFNDNARHMIRAINKGVQNGAHLGLRGARS